MSKTGIVVPCYNEETRLSIKSFAKFFETFPKIHFCFINDGSRDDTRKILEELASVWRDQVSVIHLENNKGKAEAIRAGVQHILSSRDLEFIGYWDADLSTPLDEITEFVEILSTYTYSQLVCGSRIRRMGAKIDRRWHRHYLGRLFATFASFLLDIPIYDTQCGAKLMKANLALKVFSEPFRTKWIFDVELLARVIKTLGRKEIEMAIVEVPLRCWIEKSASKLRFYDFIKCPWELIKIYAYYGTRIERYGGK